MRLLALRARTDRPLRLFGVQIPRLLRAGLGMRLRGTGTDRTLLPLWLHGVRMCSRALLGIRTRRMSRPLSLRLHRTRLSRARGALSFRLHRMRLSRARGTLLPLRLHRTRLGRMRGTLPTRLHRTRLGRACGTLSLRLHRTRLGRAAVGRLCSCRTLLGRTLRTGRIPLIAEQLIKVLKVIRHGSVSLSTWNSSLPPTRRRNPHAPRGIR